MGGNPRHQLTSHLGIVGRHRGHQGSRAQRREPDGIRDVVIPDDGGHRTKRLQRVNLGRIGIRPGQQQGRHEGSGLDHAGGPVPTDDDRGIQGTVGNLAAPIDHRLHSCADVSKLLQGGQSTHGDALRPRIADHDALLDAGLG